MSDWEAQTNSLIENLFQDGRASLYDIGFFEGTVSNETVYKKISGSFAGHAADTAIRAVASKLVLFVCRCTEDNGDSISRFIRLVEGKGNFIEKKRLTRRPDLPQSFLEIGEVENSINSLRNDLVELKSQPSVDWIRIHRDERLGHSLRGKSSFRRSLKQSELQEDALGYANLLKAAKQTAYLVFEANRIWNFTIEDPRSRIRIVSEQTKSFWNCLPVLKDVER